MNVPLTLDLFALAGRHGDSQTNKSRNRNDWGCMKLLTGELRHVMLISPPLICYN